MTLDPLTSREQAEHEEMEQLDHWAEKQYQTQLEGYVKRIWQHTSHYYVKGVAHPRTLLHRLEQVVRMAHKVERQGVAEGREDDYQLDLLLTEWGPGKLISYFGALAEQEWQ
jgi:hypothetical protein